MVYIDKNEYDLRKLLERVVEELNASKREDSKGLKTEVQQLFNGSIFSVDDLKY